MANSLLREAPGTRVLLKRLKKFNCLPYTIALKGGNPHSMSIISFGVLFLTPTAALINLKYAVSSSPGILLPYVSQLDITHHA